MNDFIQIKDDLQGLFLFLAMKSWNMTTDIQSFIQKPQNLWHVASESKQARE